MRRSLSIHFRNILLCVIVGLMSGSCIYDNIVEHDSVGEQSDVVRFVFKINAQGAAASQKPDDIVEAVRSLRVIIIDESGCLEVNERVPLSAPEYIAKTFNYIFVRPLKQGNKRVFLIANEESVKEVYLTGSTENAPSTSLRTMLDNFKIDSGGSADYTGNAFADVLNRVYFKNDYSQMMSGNTIALPYSAYYEVAMSPGALDEPAQMEQPMYLVPVAAKFDFVFTNYRKYDAYVDDIIISSLNSHNYLNAQLDNSEKRRKLLDGTDNVWWIDWLEACTREAQKADNPNLFNDLWGWIAKYRMPVPDEQMEELSLNKDNEVWMLRKIVDMSDPDKMSLGPYYVPESLNIPEGPAGQSYSLTFKVHDRTGENEYTEVTTLPDNKIETLKALFRATHVIINVEFYERRTEIYVEIAPWTEKKFWGFVQQDDDY